MAKSIFKVLQDGKIIEYQFYPYDLRFQAPSKGGSFYLDDTTDSDTFGNIKIMSTKEGVDISYTVTSNNSWITVSDKKITLNENTGTTIRNGSITLTQSETNDTMNIFFTQEVAELEFIFTTQDGTTNYTIQAQPSVSLVNFSLFSFMGSPDNTIKDITYEGIGGTLPSWIKGITQQIIFEKGRIPYIISLEENNTAYNRLASITFTQIASGKKVTIDIVQLPATQTSVTFTKSYNLTFQNNTDYTVSSRFDLNFIQSNGSVMSLFSILGISLYPKIAEIKEQGAISSTVYSTGTLTKASILSNSGYKETYKIYLNGTLIIDTVLNRPSGLNPVEVPLLVPLNAIRNGDDWKLTGMINYE